MKNPLFEKLFEKNKERNDTFLLLENESTLTFKSFIKIVNLFSGSLINLGLLPGDRVAVKLEKSYFFLALYGACVRSGMIFLPLNDSYTSEEIIFFLNDSEAKLFITTSSQSKNLPEVLLQKKALLLRTLDKDGSGTFSEVAGRAIQKSQPKID